MRKHLAIIAVTILALLPGLAGAAGLDAVQADLRIGRHEEFIRNAIALREDAG